MRYIGSTLYVLAVCCPNLPALPSFDPPHHPYAIRRLNFGCFAAFHTPYCSATTCILSHARIFTSVGNYLPHLRSPALMVLPCLSLHRPALDTLAVEAVHIWNLRWSHRNTMP